MLLMKPVKVVNRLRDFGPFFTVSPLYEPSVLRRDGSSSPVVPPVLDLYTMKDIYINMYICIYVYNYTYMYINVNIDTNSDFGTYLFGQHEEGTFTLYCSVQLWQETIWFLFYARKNHGSNVSKPPLIWCACPWLKPSCRLSLKHYLLTVSPFDKVAILLKPSRPC